MTSPADSVKKRRDSNMELLRIVAMLLVCVVHANFRALPVPTYEDVFTNVSGVVNWIAKSTFAVYLLHSNPYLASRYYDDVILSWYQEQSLFPFLLCVVSFIIVVFIIAVLLDKVYRAFFGILRKKV